MFARLIAFSGADRRGKTTQSKLLVERLSSMGFHTAYVKVPCGDGFTKRLIYRMLFDGRANRNPNMFQFLNFVNKLLFQLFVLPFMMMRYDAIILDRWTLCSIVYGSCGGASVEFCKFLQLPLIRPDITFVLTGDGFERNGPSDEYEKDDALQQRVARMYDEESRKHENVGIDAQLGRDAVHGMIMRRVLDLLIERKWMQ